VQQHILYAVELYAKTYAVHLDKLIEVNNKILRTLQNKPVLTPTSELYTAYNTLPIAELHRQQILFLAQKSLYHSEKLAEVCSNYLLLHQDIHEHNTRQKDCIYLSCPKLHMSFGQRCIRIRAGAEWNELPLYLKVLCLLENLNTKYIIT
jgi:hypothetical protein